PSSGTSTAERTDTESKAASGAGTGATTGAVLGGGAGLLAGLGMLAIPGVGPVVAAGWLVATLAGAGAGAAVGAAAGGLVGSLTAAGVPEREAHVYAEGVRRGSSLVTVRAGPDSIPTRRLTRRRLLLTRRDGRRPAEPELLATSLEGRAQQPGPSH